MAGKNGPETPADKATDKDRKHTEDLLDEALEESFPASDPPSPTRPHDLDEPA